MKRQIAFVLSLLMLPALTGCAGAPVEVPTGSEPVVPAESSYESAPTPEALPLIPFSDDAAAAPVHARWGASVVPGLEDYEAMVVDDGEYAEEVLFTTERAVMDFELVRLTLREAYDDGTLSFWTEPLCRLENLAPERPLVVRMTFPGDLPAYGISYVDAQGEGHHLLLEISGKDGSLMLREEPDFWDFVPK